MWTSAAHNIIPWAVYILVRCTQQMLKENHAEVNLTPNR